MHVARLFQATMHAKCVQSILELKWYQRFYVYKKNIETLSARALVVHTTAK